jgi:NifU-like protein involved in Fe-S cluster formation
LAAGVTEHLYTREIIRLAASIPHQRSFPQLSEVPPLRSATCGSRLAMLVKLDGEGRVASIEQAVEACAFGQASAALVGTHATGASQADALEALDKVERWLASEEAGEPWPGLDALRPARSRAGRHGAILLPFRALVAAIAEANR